MGAANCCKKPTEIIIEEIKYSEIEKEKEKDKINPLEQDSYPQDTETVPKEETNQQETSNQKLYEQEIQPQFGQAYEVPINSSTPEQQYNQYQLYENNIQQQPNEYQSNESNQPQVDLAQYNLNDPNQNININQNLSNKFEIQRSDISNTGPVDIATLTSQRSAAPVNQLQNIASVQQISSNIPQNISSQIPLKQAETQEEDLNKYFQIPQGQFTNINVLTKSKTSIPNEINMDEIQKLLEQNQAQIQSQQPKENIAAVTPVEQNEDLNKYFKNIESEEISKEDKNENAQKEIPLELKHVDINVNESLPETFGTYNIQQLGLQPQTNTNDIKKEENVNENSLANLPENLTSEQINKIIDMKDLPDTFGSSNINNMKQEPTTTTNTTKQNVDLANLPNELTREQINQIIDMKDLPETFGSNVINDFKQTTKTTTTNQNVDLTNLPQELTSEQINQIIDMKDLPETFGSNNISNQKQTTITTTTTTNVPTNIDIKGPKDINNLEQQTTTTTTQNIDLSNLPSKLTEEQINQIINMKDLPETLGSNTLLNNNKNPPTKTTTLAPTSQNIPFDLKQFGLEQSEPNQTTRTKTMPLQEEDYSKYFSQEGTTQQSSIPLDLNNLGSNITFQNPSQSINESINNLVNTNSTPIVTTTVKSSNINPTNQTNMAMSAVNSPINYGLNNTQQKTVTTTTVTKTTGIPTGNTFMQSYTLPTNFTQNKVITTSNDIQTGNNQNLQYSYSMPK